MRNFIRVVASLLIGTAVLGAAPGSKPELLTPKTGALAFVRAMEAGDMVAFQSVTVGSDDDYKLFQPLLGMVGAAKQMEKAARDKFGKDAVPIIRQSPAQGLEVHVQESDVKVTGETAVLHHKEDGDGDPLMLRKTAVGWKVDLTAIKNRDRMIAAGPGMTRMQQVFTATAGEIRAGKFAKPEDAEKSLARRIREASLN